MNYCFIFYFNSITTFKFFIIGISVSIYLAYHLANFNVEAKIIGHHIYYNLGYSSLMNNFWIMLYAFATIIPPFFSHVNRMWILGVTILISYLITYYFYENYILSVWCFFSSIISVLVYYFIKKLKININNNNI